MKSCLKCLHLKTCGWEAEYECGSFRLEPDSGWLEGYAENEIPVGGTPLFMTFINECPNCKNTVSMVMQVES